jgi:hypothetical protein
MSRSDTARRFVLSIGRKSKWLGAFLIVRSFLALCSFSLAMLTSQSNRECINQFYSKNADHAFDSWDEFPQHIYLFFSLYLTV